MPGLLRGLAARRLLRSASGLLTRCAEDCCGEVEPVPDGSCTSCTLPPRANPILTLGTIIGNDDCSSCASIFNGAVAIMEFNPLLPGTCRWTYNVTHPLVSSGVCTVGAQTHHLWFDASLTMGGLVGGSIATSIFLLFYHATEETLNNEPGSPPHQLMGSWEGNGLVPVAECQTLRTLNYHDAIGTLDGWCDILASGSVSVQL